MSCPVCIGAVVGGAAAAEYFGFPEEVVGVWVGAVIVYASLYFFKNSQFVYTMSGGMLLLTVISAVVFMVGYDRLIAGIILGGAMSILVAGLTGIYKSENPSFGRREVFITKMLMLVMLSLVIWVVFVY